MLFDWQGDGTSDHVGLVESNNGSYLTCIEGNTNNGQVLRRTRAYSTVICVIRPDYSSSTAAKPTALATPKPSTPTTSKPSTPATPKPSTSIPQITVDGL